jgi:alkanesulfonate monooxygenase SsuD/methylene tetrahydromethanopterin reductase-like flavin-dependent oxidoreductase (luciferase family)
MRYGLKLSQNATIDQYRAVWQVADDAGFDHCWCMDHFATLGPQDDGPIFEAWSLLAAMAVATSRTRIGCMVTGNTYRHPAVLAKVAVTVDHLSAGRLEFGLGAGWAENEHAMLGLPFGTRGDRADWLEEACEVIRSLWTRERTSFEGKHYQLAGAVAEPKPVQQPYPPIWTAARDASARCGSPHAMPTCGTPPAGRRTTWPRRRRYWTAGAPRSAATRLRSAGPCSSA